MAFNYHCPFCNHHSTITQQSASADDFIFDDHNKHGQQLVRILAITCPNPDCKEYSLRVSLYNRNVQEGQVESPPKKTWQLIPASNAKVLPDFIPAPVVQDYEEACAIQDLSPKASATLARRCLQGIIRDFWGISKSRLIDEIKAIEDKIDPLTLAAVDAVRKLGNIGAHMEKEIDRIIEVDPNEAGLLIGLIETLIQDWYVVRHERQQRLENVAQLAKSKETQRNSADSPDE